MLGSGWRWLPLVALASSMLLPAAAAGPSGAAVEPTDARAWLGRIHTAAQQRDYQGTMVFSANGMLSSSRVAHFCIGADSYERLESLDGQQQRIYRVNDTVRTVWPQRRLAMVEKRTPITGLPSTTQAVEPRALEQYDLSNEGTERIAGRDAQVFLLKPRDGMRYAQRLWADKATGLMLRADVIDAGEHVLESAAFSQVDIGMRGTQQQAEGLKRESLHLAGYRILESQQQHTQLEAEGWTVTHPVAGFKNAGCVKRSRDGAGGAAQVLQAVFSDGLTHVSMFIEPAEAQAPVPDAQAQLGATSTLRLRRGAHWITVMGDVPAPTLKAFADALEPKR